MKKPGSFDYELPLKYLSVEFISSFSDICSTKSFNVFVKFVKCTFMLLTFVFCVSKHKGMTTKNSEEATYGWEFL